MVYFVQPVDGGPVKIGHSIDVEARIRLLEAKYKRPLSLLATMPGGRKEEKAVHERFTHLRFGMTEQSQPAAELMQFIGKPLFVNASPVEAMEDHDKPVIVVLRGSLGFKQFVQEAAKKDRSTVAKFLERAIVKYAKYLGVEGEVPDR